MAGQAIEANLRPLPAEVRPLEICIGQTLRQDVLAERDNPPFDRVCMDGIAIHSDAWQRGLKRFRIEAVQRAGEPAVVLAHGDSAIEVMTGAVLPHGTNCVIPQEEYDAGEGEVALKGTAAAGVAWRNVQRRGADSLPGEPMLVAGTVLGAPEMAAVASAGLAQVQVSRQPRVMVISTGDELVAPGLPILPHQVRRSNAYAVLAALQGRGFAELADDHLPDDEHVLRERLALYLGQHDFLVLSGGISKGRFDLVPAVLKSLGVKEVFQQVAQRPGMPMWFGVGPAGQAVFGLPGNPVSTLICLIRYVVPALKMVMGSRKDHQEPIALAEAFKFKRPMTYFLPVAVQHDGSGRALAVARPANGPGDFLSLTRAQGFVELPPQPEGHPAGAVVSLYRW
jgi:molybdopterin molybdotransferase